MSEDVGETKVIYTKGEYPEVEKIDYLTLFYHQLMRVNLWEDNGGEAANALLYIRQRCPGSLRESMRDAVRAVHLKCPL